MIWKKQSIRHLDLFSGIGGFAYAARTVWGDRYENAGFCDNNWFCQQVLRKNFPGCKIFSDIRVLADAAGQGLERSDGQEQALALGIGRVDLITGGFPCQPFSAAGRRRGTIDDRYLWPEMLAVIRRFLPAWVIAENVGGLVTWQQGVVLEQVCIDLESAGYEVQPFIIPAVSVNAPHRRDRIWFVAHRTGGRRSRGGTEAKAQERREPQPMLARQLPSRFEGQNSWDREWPQVAAELCGLDDGLPHRMVRFPDGTATSEARWRREALKAYGNAIVPQVAMRIMHAIKEANDR